MYKLAVLIFVKVGYKRLNTALKVIFVLNDLVLSLVAQNYSYSAVEERLLSHSVCKNIVLEDRFLKYRGVGLEGHLYSVRSFGTLSFFAEGTRDLTSLKSLGISLSLIAVVKLDPLGKRVYNGCADAVKTSGYLISTATEFSARVKYGINHLRRRYTLFWVDSRRNTASVILYGNTVSLVYSNGYLIAKARKSLVNRVIHYLVNKVMKSADRGSTYIHTRTLSYRLKSLKNLYLIFVIHLIWVVFHFFRSFSLF